MLRASSSYFTSPEEPRWVRWLLVIVSVPLFWIYVAVSRENGEFKNNDVYANDQKVYLNVAHRIWEDRFGYFTPRQRTPGYPYLLSLFCHEGFSSPEGSELRFNDRWFERGKQLNLWLSVGLLVGLFMFCRTVLPGIQSFLISAGAGLLLFPFKAAYVQPELLSWVLNLILFVCLGRLLIRPNWWLAASCGALAAMAFLVKGGTLPLIVLFAVCWVGKVLWDTFRKGERKVATTIGQGALVLVVFLAALSPYFANSAHRFGNPFYSIYSEYMVWLPLKHDGDVDRDHLWAVHNSKATIRPLSVEEYNDQLAARIRKRIGKELKAAGTPDLRLAEQVEAAFAEQFHPVEQLPSASTYFATYPLHTAPGRVMSGLKASSKRLNKYYRRALTLLRWVGTAVVAGLLWQLARDRWRSLGEAFLRWPYLVVYAVGFFVGYASLYAWFDALGIGPRLILSLYLPLLFSGTWLAWRLLEGASFAIGRHRIHIGKVANALLLLALAYGAARLFGGELLEYANTGG